MDEAKAGDPCLSDTLAGSMKRWSRHLQDPRTLKLTYERERKSMDGKNRKDIKPGLKVEIVLKKDQRTGKRTEGVVAQILTNSSSTLRDQVRPPTASGRVARIHG